MSGKKIGTFSLVMINIIAVDSIRSLPFSAEYGFSLIFYYMLGALLFFLPISFITAELATGWPEKGGIYVWIREAFGKKCAFFIIWLQWVYNIVWYPTILSLVAGTLAYLINPDLMHSKTYMVSVVLVLFWASTLVNCFGVKISSLVSTVGAIIGTLLPMLFIIGLGVFWFFGDRPVQIQMNAATFFPKEFDFTHLSFLVAVLFGLIGMEMSASHADEVKNPHKSFPRAILLSAIIIIGSLIGASLAIAMVIPSKDLNLITGIVQAYRLFLDSFGLTFLVPVIEILIIIGGLCGVSAWIIGPSKGVLIAANDGVAPEFFKRVNKKGVPTNILLLQGCIFTVICSVYLLLPTVRSSFWAFTAMTAQLALMVYVGLFLSGIYLRYKEPLTKREFKVPFGNIGIIILGSVGTLTCLFAIFLGFIPPAEVNVGNIYLYEAILVVGIIALSCPPFLIALKRRRSITKK